MSRILAVLILIGVLTGAVGAAVVQPLPVPSLPLFAPADASVIRAATVPPEQVGTRRSRIALVDPAAVSQLRGGALTLNLFEDAAFTAVGEVQPESAARGLSSTLWTGTLSGIPGTNVVLLSDAFGNIDLRVLALGRNFYVQSLGGGVVRISEIDPSAGRYARDGQPIDDGVPAGSDEAGQREVALNLASPRADDGSIVDVMVVYTPAAVALLGSEAAARLAIEATVALTNISYQNSGVNFRLRLVHVAQVDYVEQGFSDLNRLSGSGDGFMDIVHQWRSDYAADLVALMPGTSVANRNYCGIASLPLSMPSPNSAFSITEALCISDITFAHELGHNMGKAHDHANGSSAIHPYAYGYQDNSTGVGDYGDWVTVMAYSTGGQCPGGYIPGVCPAIAYWSDNEATYLGKPLGNPGINGEDNAQSLNETALAIANYRISGDGGTTVPTPVPTLTPIPTPGTTAPPLLLNGSFEFDNDLNSVPDAWAWGAAGGIRACAIAGLPDGTCQSSLMPGGKVIQSFSVDGLAANDQINLSLNAIYRGADAVGCGLGRLIVKYVDGSAGVSGNGRDTLVLAPPAGLPNQWHLTVGMLTLDSAPKSARIVLSAIGCQKPWRFDGISVTQAP